MGKLNTWIPNSFNLNKGLYAWDGKGREMLIYSTTNNRTEQNFSKKKATRFFKIKKLKQASPIHAAEHCLQLHGKP